MRDPPSCLSSWDKVLFQREVPGRERRGNLLGPHTVLQGFSTKCKVNETRPGKRQQKSQKKIYWRNPRQGSLVCARAREVAPRKRDDRLIKGAGRALRA